MIFCVNTAVRQPWPGSTIQHSSVEGILPGSGSAEVVIVGAHFDSIATDPSPGADDDASGIAGILSIAKIICSLIASGGRLARRNPILAVQWGGGSRRGSIHYARALYEGTQITPVAMIQLDMIGRPSAWSTDVYELHPPGWSDCLNLSPGIRARCSELAFLIANSERKMHTNLSPEVFVLPNDPVAGGKHSSDHCSFLSRNWPSCLVMENAFGPA